MTLSALAVLQRGLPAGSVAVTNPLGWEREDLGVRPRNDGCRVGAAGGQPRPARRWAVHAGRAGLCGAGSRLWYGQLPGGRLEATGEGLLVADLAFAPNDNREFNLLSDNRQEPPYYKIETPFFRVYLRRDSGILVSFYDKRVGRELVGFGMRRGSDYTDSALLTWP